MLDRADLALALEALQPDQAVLGSARSHLMTILGDVRQRDEADDVLAAILILRPRDPEREVIASLAIAAVKALTRRGIWSGSRNRCWLWS